MCTAAAYIASRDGARFFPAALDLILPTRCLACGERLVAQLYAGAVCRPCWRSLPALAPERCAVCSEPTPGAAEPLACGRCLASPPPFAALRAAAPYAGSARAVLVAFKFRGADYLAAHLARLVVERCAGFDARAGFDEVACVPDGSLARWRRDHAARTLAEEVARRLALPFAPDRLLKRRATKRQSGLPAHRRAANVRGAFAASGPPERVLLVDDVATSGSTARECARALLRAGARHVEVWCFARASRQDAILPAPVVDREGDPGRAETRLSAGERA